MEESHVVYPKFTLYTFSAIFQNRINGFTDRQKERKKDRNRGKKKGM